MATTTLAALKTEPQANGNVAMSMETVAGFENMQRIAKLFSASTIVPKAYRGNMADCFLAVDMAMRMGANPLMVMQNLYVVHGHPTWSAQFLIATFNKCGRFTALRYEFVGEQGKDNWGCRAVTMELATGEKLIGPLITIGIAKKEGWYDKDGSKWKTMPEQMLRYRAAAWLVRAYAPEIAMGLHTAEEEQDVIRLEAKEVPPAVTLDDLQKDTQAGTQEPIYNLETGEVSEGEDDIEEDTDVPRSDYDASYMISCPNGKEVDERDCIGKPCRKGCPAFE